MGFFDKLLSGFGYHKVSPQVAQVSQDFSKEEAPEILAKAYAMLADNPEALERAAHLAAERQMPMMLKKAVPFDDFDDLKHENFKYQEYDDRLLLDQLYTSNVRPSGITNDTIRTLVFRSTLLSSIIQRRVWQVQSFANPQKTRYDLGFQIEPKSGEVPTLRQQEDIKRLTEMVENLGFLEYDPMRGSFKDFLRLTIQDSLMFDGMCLERIYSRSGVPIAFKAIDGGAIHPRFDEDTRGYVYDEMINGAVVNTYTPDEVVYYVRNKTTDRRWLGYGISEVERLINTITCHLYAEEYNKRLFKSGHFLSGVVSLKGNISRSQFQEFKRDFYSFVTGVENTNRVAIVNAPQGIEFNSAIRSPNEMGFSTFMDYMVKVASSVFMMDPVEINFFVTGGANNQGSQNINLSSQEFRLKYSKDAGLRPLLDCVADFVNRSILDPVSEGEYALVFKGLDEDDKKTRQEYVIKSNKYLTINEVRALEGYPPLEDETLGSVIDNSVYGQLLFAKSQAAQQEGPEGQAPEGTQEVDTSRTEDIRKYMQESGYDDESIETVLNAYTTGAITFDDFLEYTGADPEEFAQTTTPEQATDNLEEENENQE